MAVHLVIGRVKKGLGIFGRGVDMSRFNNPNADALVAATIHVAGVFECHLSVSSVEAANVLMAEPLFGADEYFPEWPVFHEVMK